MKIAVCSDVHLEFGTLSLKNPGDVDVLILSGDICVARDLMEYEPLVSENMRSSKSIRYHDFFAECAREFAHVVYIVGNHEHYHGDFKYTISDLKQRLGYLNNLHILDKEVFDIGDYRFIGGTLWTDMNREDPLTLHAISGMMNDYKHVKNSNRTVSYKTFDINESGVKIPAFHTRDARFSPEDSVADHRAMLDYIRLVYEDTPPWVTTIVVGHHAPSKSSTHPRYKDETLMNGAYSSDLSEFIMDRPGIKLWTHGHTHEDFDYMIKSCRVVCNPRGYINYEDRADNFTLKVVEL